MAAAKVATGEAAPAGNRTNSPTPLAIDAFKISGSNDDFKITKHKSRNMNCDHKDIATHSEAAATIITATAGDSMTTREP
jgi:hypothetical protein